MPETMRTLITGEDFNAFEVAFDRQTWPDGGLVLPATKRQLAAVRVALEETAREWRARWVAEALKDAAVDMGSGYLRGLAAEYRDGRR